jgi:hypothetical protein
MGSQNFRFIFFSLSETAENVLKIMERAYLLLRGDDASASTSSMAQPDRRY